ncbi:MAG: hypothetical protein H7070_16665 [Saprospiraceae bacterium]|nr:hypothetical protein [Pyrinomonadaceae bacterium]
MVSRERIAVELPEMIDAHFEWLLIRENGRTFPLQKTEIEITDDEHKVLFGFLGDEGFETRRIEDFTAAGDKITLVLATNFGREKEEIRLVPRVSANELSLTVELARLQKANETSRAITETFPHLKLIRVSLNAENGRFAQIIVEAKSGAQTAILSDVSEIATPETLLTSAILWLRKLQMRTKKPISEIWIVGEKRQARNLQKLHGLLGEPIKGQIKILEISRKAPNIRELKSLGLSDLWRGTYKKLVLPQTVKTSVTAKRIIEAAPEEIDIVFSKQGETLRFLGLPFARVRRMLGIEKAWFGIERNRKTLAEESFGELVDLIENLQNYRRPKPSDKRHELYRLSPESWLESILRRNIKLLDANLILSPIYNQFRTSADKIDLLALRKDGRLVIIELKTSPDREMLFQAADYWRKIELQRRRGELKKAKAFGDLEILDKPALVYTVAPALSFHRDYELFAKMLSKEIEIWRFELHENWRENLKVIARKSYSE